MKTQASLFLLAALFMLAASLFTQESRHYFYDASGQLVGVITPEGSIIIYSFDEVGNRTGLSVKSLEADSVGALIPETFAIGATEATIIGKGLGSATGITSFEPGIAIAIAGPITDTFVPVLVTISQGVPPGDYPFTIHRSSGGA